MRTSARDRESIKPRHPIVEFEAYIDTLVVFPAWLEKGDRKRLYEAHGRFVRVEEIRTPLGVNAGYRVTTHQPQPDVLHELCDLQMKRDGTLGRVDIAFDARSHSLSHAETIQWIKGHVLMRHRKQGPLLEFVGETGTTTYFNPHAHAQRSPRDAALYSDLPSKIDGIARAHIDLRTRGLTPIRKIAGRDNSIETTLDIEHSSPLAIFRNNFKVTSFDAARWRNEQLRRTLREYRELDAARDRACRHPLHDAYAESMKHRIEGYQTRAQYEYAQAIPVRMNTDYSLVRVRDEWVWGAVKRQNTEKTIIDIIE